MDLKCVLYLQDKGFLTPARNRMLDVGPQNVYHCSADDVRTLVRRQGASPDPAFLDAEAERLAHFSTPRPDEVTTLFSEMADLAGIDYHAIDVCPAPRTVMLDMNYDMPGPEWSGSFDAVLNFGTTEHVFNQWNSFEIIHDAAKVGGVMYHVLPATGYVAHGYYCYTPVFFRDLVAANDYQLVDMFLVTSGESFAGGQGLDVRAKHQIGVPGSAGLEAGADRVPDFDIHVVVEKTSNRPFRCSLEVATAHSALADSMAGRYQDVMSGGAIELGPMSRQARTALSAVKAECTLLGADRDGLATTLDGVRAELAALQASTSWRVGKALVQPWAFLKRAARAGS